jgi:allantoinase
MIAQDYLRYPKRQYGMDHDRYDWSMLPDRPAVQWPGGARVALWVTASLQWFPLNQKGVPFKPVGSLQTAYPDLRHYTLRDYGNRVGIYRIMKELRARNIPASVPINAAVAARYPSLAQACVDLGWELMGHGLDMDHVHHTGMADEAQIIERSLDIVRRFAPVRGWLSPARSESHDTLDLLASAGIDYVCDWVNDDMPYPMRASPRPRAAA